MDNNKIREAKQKLKEHNIDENLASYLFKYLDKSQNYDRALELLINNYPIQYIIGNVNFYGNIIKVNEDVLIPRFETELLVEKTIAKINELFPYSVDIADIGTGSGCIAVTLKKELNNSCVTATDISEKALELARINAKENRVEIDFKQGDLLEPLSKKFDILISNPPYISYNEEIMELVKDNEPHLALYAPNNGLYFYEEILKNCSNYLKEKFLIAFEIGYTQADQITSLATQYLQNINIYVEKDYSAKDRFIFIDNFVENQNSLSDMNSVPD